MDTFVEDFACKLDEAKTLAVKMSINQQVEILKYVFVFLEQLQKDLIEKLTLKGSLVTFSFIPELDSANSIQSDNTVVYTTPGANITHIKRRLLEEYNCKSLPSVTKRVLEEEEEEELENYDRFRQTCEELDEHICSQFSPHQNGAVHRKATPLDSEMSISPVCLSSSSPERTFSGLQVDRPANAGDSTVSLICLAGPQSRTVSQHCKRTLAAKVRASLNRSKSENASSESNSTYSAKRRRRRQSDGTETPNVNLNNGLADDASGDNRFKGSVGRPCRRKRINGKYTCTFPGCLDKYSNAEHVADHELQHTVPGGHFWPCSQCPQRFKWRHYLRLHLKLQHSCTDVTPTEMPVV